MGPIEYINEITNVGKFSQSALGFAFPPIIPLKTVVVVKEAQDKDADEELQRRLKSGLVENTNWIVPLTFRTTDLGDFKLPLDPVIALSGKNIITRRYVNKSKTRGTIKERWSEDDWEISITGVIIEENEELRLKHIGKLRSFCEYAGTVEVICPLFNEMDITRIVIESYDFPFTRGIENQAFIIKAYSDESYTLLIEQ
jgi:hypothetical protein